MSERTYYVLCEDNCKFEGMTKEQIIAAIAEATGAVPTQIDDAFITKIKETNNNRAIKFFVGTTAEINAIPAAHKDPNTIYIPTDSSTTQDIMAAINVQKLRIDGLITSLYDSAVGVLIGGTDSSTYDIYENTNSLNNVELEVHWEVWDVVTDTPELFRGTYISRFKLTQGNAVDFDFYTVGMERNTVEFLLDATGTTLQGKVVTAFSSTIGCGIKVKQVNKITMP